MYNDFFITFITISHIVDGKVQLLPLIKTGCNVIFYKYKPLNLELYSYIVLIIKNTYSHQLLLLH